MTETIVIVGAREWLMLGALVQAPKHRLPIAVLYSHMAPWWYPHQVRDHLISLRAKGLIRAEDQGLVAALIDGDVKAVRSRRETSVPRFWPLVLPLGVILE